MTDTVRGNLDIGGVIGKTFGVWIKNFVPFAVISLVIYSPVILMRIAAANAPATDQSKWQGVIALVQQALSYVVSGALTYGVLQSLRGKPVGVGPCVSMGFSRLFPVLGVSLLTALCVLGGFILLVIPGIVVACMLAVTVPVAVIEKPPVTAALRRSRELTQGSKLTIFLIYLVIGILGYVIATVFGLLVHADNVVGGVVVALVTLVVAGALGGALPAVIYHDLRMIKEGASVEDVAKVFD